ncbi:MAG: hypothetical protein WD200_01145 [Candidatus Andersenbacteria bacterium]
MRDHTSHNTQEEEQRAEEEAKGRMTAEGGPEFDKEKHEKVLVPAEPAR